MPVCLVVAEHNMKDFCLNFVRFYKIRNRKPANIKDWQSAKSRVKNDVVETNKQWIINICLIIFLTSNIDNSFMHYLVHACLFCGQTQWRHEIVIRLHGCRPRGRSLTRTVIKSPPVTVLWRGRDRFRRGAAWRASSGDCGGSNDRRRSVDGCKWGVGEGGSGDRRGNQRWLVDGSRCIWPRVCKTQISSVILSYKLCLW